MLRSPLRTSCNESCAESRSSRLSKVISLDHISSLYTVLDSYKAPLSISCETAFTYPTNNMGYPSAFGYTSGARDASLDDDMAYGELPGLPNSYHQNQQYQNGKDGVSVLSGSWWQTKRTDIDEEDHNYSHSSKPSSIGDDNDDNDNSSIVGNHHSYDDDQTSSAFLEPSVQVHQLGSLTQADRHPAQQLNPEASLKVMHSASENTRYTEFGSERGQKNEDWVKTKNCELATPPQTVGKSAYEGDEQGVQEKTVSHAKRSRLQRVPRHHEKRHWWQGGTKAHQSQNQSHSQSQSQGDELGQQQRSDGKSSRDLTLSRRSGRYSLSSSHQSPCTRISDLGDSQWRTLYIHDPTKPFSTQATFPVKFRLLPDRLGDGSRRFFQLSKVPKSVFSKYVTSSHANSPLGTNQSIHELRLMLHSFVYRGHDPENSHESARRPRESILKSSHPDKKERTSKSVRFLGTRLSDHLRERYMYFSICERTTSPGPLLNSRGLQLTYTVEDDVRQSEQEIRDVVFRMMMNGEQT